MKWLSRKFEAWLESFLRKNLERHTRILSWVVLVLLAGLAWATWVFFDYQVVVKDPNTGQTVKKAIGRLILGDKD